MCIAALAGAIAIGALLPLPFLITLGGYIVLTLAYSLALKRQPILDVIALAGLYGMIGLVLNVFEIPPQSGRPLA